MGFFLSSVATSETRAVELAMLVLLASIFFGGFFLPLANLWTPVRAISYLLPVTFGASTLRDVLLLGVAPTPVQLLAPLVLGLALYVLAARSLSRELAPQ
jgi:ABC-2 type transport system permease protein